MLRNIFSTNCKIYPLLSSPENMWFVFLLKEANCFIFKKLNLYPAPTPPNRALGGLIFCVCWHCGERLCSEAIGPESLQNTSGPVEEYSPPLNAPESSISRLKLAHFGGQFNGQDYIEHC